tara:strand:+ start:170 stop:385 length:216 start_codon:yes stop_codon:yes gene_type:complete
MKFFYLSSSTDINNQYVVHERDCQNMPSIYDRDYLGPFNTAMEALRFAAMKKQNISICPICGCLREIYVFT